MFRDPLPSRSCPVRRLLLLLAAAGGLLSTPLAAQDACGGEERWAVKMAADPGAAQIDLQQPVLTSLHDLVRLVRPSLPSDDVTRTASERIVRTVEARLVRFKKESGKTGDSDYHLVISDATLLYTAGGNSNPVSPHSFIAEIPDPACVGGREGTVTTPSRFATELGSVVAAFTQRFPSPGHGWNDAQGVPVRLTGVVFFDKNHGQVGRALNGIELHPLLAIEFDPAPLVGPAVGSGVALVNPGFESGATGWTTTESVITTSAQEPAHGGAGVAWLGGYGTAHTDRLAQTVALPATAGAIALTFFLHIDTEETGSAPLDRLRIRVRTTGGELLKTLKTLSNLNAAPGYVVHSVDLTQFKGRTVRLSFEATEDSGSLTSFVLDDLVLVVEPPPP
jgi:hypothetical protein